MALPVKFFTIVLVTQYLIAVKLISILLKKKNSWRSRPWLIQLLNVSTGPKAAQNLLPHLCPLSRCCTLWLLLYYMFLISLKNKLLTLFLWGFYLFVKALENVFRFSIAYLQFVISEFYCLFMQFVSFWWVKYLCEKCEVWMVHSLEFFKKITRIFFLLFSFSFSFFFENYNINLFVVNFDKEPLFIIIHKILISIHYFPINS